MDNDIQTKLKKYLTHQLLRQDHREINLEDKLISNGVVDSFNLVDLATYIEETFGVEIKPSELNAKTFDTFGELVKLIANRKSKYELRSENFDT